MLPLNSFTEIMSATLQSKSTTRKYRVFLIKDATTHVIFMIYTISHHLEPHLHAESHIGDVWLPNLFGKLYMCIYRINIRGNINFSIFVDVVLEKIWVLFIIVKFFIIRKKELGKIYLNVDWTLKSITINKNREIVFYKYLILSHFADFCIFLDAGKVDENYLKRIFCTLTIIDYLIAKFKWS